MLSLCGFFLSYAGAEKTGEEGKTNASPEQARNSEASESSGAREIVVLEINGTINPATLDYIRTGLEDAEAKSAQALFILLDTPGGLLTSTKEIVKLILNSSIPVVVYVSPKGATATSAGVFITLSANIAAMAPGTSIGAAHPVTLGPGGTQPDKKEPAQDKSIEKELQKDVKGTGRQRRGV